MNPIPPPTEKISVARISVPPGEALARKTLSIMRSFALKASENFAFRRWVSANIVVLPSTVEPKTNDSRIMQICDYARQNFRYIGDPANAEWIQSPVRTIDLGGGDCDDLATLIAAIAVAVGIPARFVSFSKDGVNFTHVRAELWDAHGSWVPCDPVGSADEAGFRYFITQAVS